VRRKKIINRKLSLNKRNLHSTTSLNLIAKLMKHLDGFSEDCRLDEMTFNELKFYADVLPIYENVLKGSESSVHDWTPKFYFGFYDFDKGLSI
jgi:hypothetical protein